MSGTAFPKGWLRAKLSDVIEPRGEKASPVGCDHLKFLGMDHVEAQTTRIIGSIPASSMKSSAARFYAGDVLYGRLRPYLNKVAQPNFDGLASAEFIVFPDGELIRSKFLKHRLNSADFVSFASHLNEGDRPRVSFDQIGDFEVLVPPLNEQLRIVAKIEELFSELDKGIESLKSAQAQLKVYRQSLLKHAFEGKLTAQWRADNSDKLETADDLLKRIQQERAQRYQQQTAEWEAGGKKGSKPKEPNSLSSLTAEELIDLPELPEGWGWVSLEAIQNPDKHAVKAGPFGSALKKEFYVERGYKIYGQEQVIRGDHKYGDYFVSETKYSELASCAIKPQDVLISLVGTIGKVLVLPLDVMPGIINPRLVKISLNLDVYRPEFFQAYFESGFLRS